MNYTVKSGFRSGKVSIPASKSYAHRQLICAALSDAPATILCDGMSKDITATIECLKAMGAIIDISGERISIEPIKNRENAICLPCNESGSTLRFLLPVVAALGMKATFVMSKGLAARPVQELLDVMSSKGVSVVCKEGTISIEGQMMPGDYYIPGDVSSQYISGLLMALPLLSGDSTLSITGNTESKDYIKITEDVLKKSNIEFNTKENMYQIAGNQQYHVKEISGVEQDWSNAAFFLCMGALSKRGIVINEMPIDSTQGDKAILDILRNFGADIDISGNTVAIKRNTLTGINVDASTVPDLVPTIASLASLASGTTRIFNAKRLRIKESDRLKTTSDMLKLLGAQITEKEDELIIVGQHNLIGNTIDAANDHRIAMAAAVAANGCKKDVTVVGSECVNKSFPLFWEYLEGLEVTDEQ